MLTPLPFLLHFRTHRPKPPEYNTRYDPILDRLLIEEEGYWVPATSSSKYALESKKADIEKGEDQKGP